MRRVPSSADEVDGGARLRRVSGDGFRHLAPNFIGHE
jgi:hypothetical protein